MSAADDVHAKLIRALESAEGKLKEPETKSGVRVESPEILAALVQPLALASIALELHEMRPRMRDTNDSRVVGDRIEVGLIRLIHCQARGDHFEETVSGRCPMCRLAQRDFLPGA